MADLTDEDKAQARKYGGEAALKDLTAAKQAADEGRYGYAALAGAKALLLDIPAHLFSPDDKLHHASVTGAKVGGTAGAVAGAVEGAVICSPIVPPLGSIACGVAGAFGGAEVGVAGGAAAGSVYVAATDAHDLKPLETPSVSASLKNPDIKTR